MATVWVYIFVSILVVSLISLIGVFFLALKKELLNKSLHYLISLAVGGLLGASFFHLIPETFEKLPVLPATLLLALGFALFFVLERILHWNHNHSKTLDLNKIKSFGPLNLIADFLHNFLDGILISAAYLVDIHVGIITTIAILLHEVPQEIGDFGVLVHAGYKEKKALVLNFLSACSAFIGAVFFLLFKPVAEYGSIFILPVAAGGFLYLAIVDLLPEVYSKKKLSVKIRSTLFILLGISCILLLTFFEHNHS